MTAKQMAMEIAETVQVAQAALRDAEKTTSNAWQVYNQGCFIAGQIKRKIETGVSDG